MGPSVDAGYKELCKFVVRIVLFILWLEGSSHLIVLAR